jgi:hypothetical protein
MTSLEIKRLDQQKPTEIPIFLVNNEPSNKSEQNMKSPTRSASNGGQNTLTRTDQITMNNASLKCDLENDKDDIGDEFSDRDAPSSPAITEKSTDQTGANQFQFNKYGFLQPSTNSSMSASLQRLSSTSTNVKSSEYINRLSTRSLGSGQSPNGSCNNTNYKERMQSIGIEYFSEDIPIDVIRKREIKWIEMLNNYDDTMNKHFLKLKSRCRKGECVFYHYNH